MSWHIQIIKNFINLSLQEPEIFPEQLQIESDIGQAPSSNTLNNQETNEIARKLLTHFERKGMSELMLELVTTENEAEFRE